LSEQEQEVESTEEQTEVVEDEGGQEPSRAGEPDEIIDADSTDEHKGDADETSETPDGAGEQQDEQPQDADEGDHGESDGSEPGGSEPDESDDRHGPQDGMDGSPVERAVAADEADQAGEADELDDLFLSPDDDMGDVIEVDVIDGEEAEQLEQDLEGGAADKPEVSQPDKPDLSQTAAAQKLRKEYEAERGELQARIEELEQKLEAVQEERDQTKERLMRSAADLENYRKRSKREREEMRKYGIDKLCLELLPAVDNLERALAHAEASEEESNILDGVKMVYKQILSALEKHGVTGFDAEGEKFNPEHHEAIQQVESSEHETGEVVEQFQKGYVIHDRLLRPALVSVAKRVDGGDNGEQSQETEQRDEERDSAESESSDAEQHAEVSQDADATHDEEAPTPESGGEESGGDVPSDEDAVSDEDVSTHED
jgi:molecular chaperone GrpE